MKSITNRQGEQFNYSGPTIVTSTFTPSSVDTLTNKSLASGSTFLIDPLIPTRRVGFNIGGTAGTTLTLRNVQTADRDITYPDASTTLVGTNNIQTITSKIITDVTNIVAANTLKTTGASVNVSTAAPPSAGQVLTATAPDEATWQTPSGGSTGAYCKLTYPTSGFGFASITFTAANTPSEIIFPLPGVLGLITTDASVFALGSALGRLQYNGASTVFIKVLTTLTIANNTTTKTYRLWLYKNGVVISDSAKQAQVTGGLSVPYEHITLAALVSMAPGDYISMFTSNNTDTAALYVHQVNMMAEICR